MFRLLSFPCCDPRLLRFKDVSLQEALVLDMEAGGVGDMCIGVEYRVPYNTLPQRLKFNALSLNEERLREVFKGIFELQPNMRAVYSRDEEGRWQKHYLSADEAVKHMKIYDRPPQKSDLSTRSVPTCAVYSYQDKVSKEWVYAFRMHHVGADAKGGFQILKGAGVFDAGVQVHRLFSSALYYAAAAGTEYMTGLPFLSQSLMADPMYSSPKPVERESDVGWRMRHVHHVADWVAPMLPRGLQPFLQLGSSEPNEEYAIYKRAVDQKQLDGGDFKIVMSAFRETHMPRYRPLAVGVHPDFSHTDGTFNLPESLTNVKKKGREVADVTTTRPTTIEWDRAELDALFLALADKFEGSLSTGLCFEMIFGIAMAHLNKDKPVPTRVPRSVMNPQGHSDYGATATLSCGVDISQPFLTCAKAAKTAFKAQLKAPFSSIPAEESARRMRNPWDVQACSNYFPEEMASNPFPFPLLGAVYGNQIGVNLHLGNWFHPRYQILVDNTVQQTSTHYRQTVSTNETFMQDDFGKEVIEAMTAVVAGLKADCQSGTLRPVSDYFPS